MDSQLSEASLQLARIRESIRGGNWEIAEALARSLGTCAPPSHKEALEEYLTSLKDILILAKSSRSNAAASLARVRAAARFQAAWRQDFAESTDFRRRFEPDGPLPSEL